MTLPRSERRCNKLPHGHSNSERNPRLNTDLIKSAEDNRYLIQLPNKEILEKKKLDEYETWMQCKNYFFCKTYTFYEIFENALLITKQIKMHRYYKDISKSIMRCRGINFNFDQTPYRCINEIIIGTVNIAPQELLKYIREKLS